MAILVPFLLLQAYLELEPGFPRPVRQRRDPPVILEAGAVENDLVDPLVEALLGDRRADLLGEHLLVLLLLLLANLATLGLLVVFFGRRPREGKVRRSRQRL